MFGTAVRNTFVISLVGLVLSGCMAAAQHREHMDQAHRVGKDQGITVEIRNLERGVLSRPDANGKRHIELNTDVITLMELGALYHYAGEFERSNEALEIVYAHYADEEMKTDINLSGIVTGGVKAFVSEGLGGPYELAGYEKVYLHTLKALNYMMLGDLEAARVEVVRAEYQQARIEDEIAEKAAEAKKERKAKGAQLSNVDASQSAQSENQFMEQAALTPQEKQLVAGLKDGYRNAMTYNLSAIVYELHRILDGNAAIDDAVLDLRKSLELYSNPGVADRFTRWALYRHRANESRYRTVYRKVKAEYPAVVKSAKRKPSQMRNVHVFLHTGDSPRVEALDIRFPNPVSLTMSKVSVPRYRPIPDQNYRLALSSGSSKGNAGQQLDFDALALKSFDDKLPGIYFRAVTRVVVNTAVDDKLKEQAGLMGQLFAAMKNEMIEQADTRSWTSLPKTIYYGTFYTAEDRVKVQVSNQSGRELFSKEYSVESGKVLVVNIRKFGGSFIDHHTYLEGGPGAGKGRRAMGDDSRGPRTALEQDTVAGPEEV